MAGRLLLEMIFVRAVWYNVVVKHSMLMYAVALRHVTLSGFISGFLRHGLGSV